MKSQEMPLHADQQQISDQTKTRSQDRVGRDALQRWTEKSVWSLVCAMELGLVSEPPLSNNASNDRSPLRINTPLYEPYPPINSPINVASRSSNTERTIGLQLSAKMPAHPSKKISRKLTNDQRKKKRKGKDKNRVSEAVSNVETSNKRRDRKLDRTEDSTTMERFWKSRKRKQGGIRKRTNRDPTNFTDSDRLGTTYEQLIPDRSRDQVYLASKRKRVKNESLPSRANRCSAANDLASRISFPRARASVRKISYKNDTKKVTGRPMSDARAVGTVETVETVDLGAFKTFTSLNEQKEQTFVEIRCEYSENERYSSKKDDKGVSSSNDRQSTTTWQMESNDASKRLLENDRHLTDGASSIKFDDMHTLPLAKRISNEVKPSRKNEQNDSCMKRNKMFWNKNAMAIPIEKVGRSDTFRDIRKVSVTYEENREVRRVTRGSTKIGKDLFVGKLVWGYCSGWWPALIIDADHVGMLSEAGKLWVYWIGEARISLLNEKTQIELFSSNLKGRLTQNLNIARIHVIDATMQMLRNRLGCALTKPYFTWIENNFLDMIEMLDEIKFYPYPAKVQQRLDYLKQKNAKVTEKFLLDQKRETQGKKLIEKSKDSPQRNDVDLTRLPLKEQNPGVIAWAKIAGHSWWPAMIIDYRDCCMREPSFGCQWIMWYGDYKLSEVHHQLFLRFDKGFEKMRDYTNNTKKHIYLVGVLQASKDYCFRLGFETENWTLNDALEYFSKSTGSQTLYELPKKVDSVKIYDKYSAHIVEKLNELKNNPNVDDKRADDISNSDDLRSVISGNIALQSLCLKCLKVCKGKTEIHPFFEGSLCNDCSEQYKPCMFVFGNDAKCFYCTVCAATGMVIICDKEDCPRVYCIACMKHLLCPTTYEQVLREDPWECFLCTTESQLYSDAIVRRRANWKDKIIDMFRTNCSSNVRQIDRNREKKKIRVLSLFDGLGTGLLVLLKLGLVVDVYYASEIDPDALMVSTSHFGDRIIHLGNVKDIATESIKEIAPIDLLIGGSPCNDLSLANPARLGLYDPKGTGILFFEYCRILELVKKINNGHHLFWLYENVASMPSEYRFEINKHLGQEPDAIDSADFSPQHRLRLYWHNLPIEPHSLSFQEEQDVQDILTPHCQRYALVKKIRTVTTKVNSLKQGKLALKPILMKNESDSLWITELERIFGFPRHYTDVKNLSATKRQRLIGKSWSVQTLTAILRSLCPFFEYNSIERN